MLVFWNILHTYMLVFSEILLHISFSYPHILKIHQIQISSTSGVNILQVFYKIGRLHFPGPSTFSFNGYKNTELNNG